MAGISNNPNSPRQRMINLMYLVFIAMMALNVSSEVLDGFELVERSSKLKGYGYKYGKKERSTYK